MTIETGEVPDHVLQALFEAAPAYAELGFGHNAETARGDWRKALAVALTAWEGSRPAATYARGHECAWRTVGVQHRDALLGIKQTDVLQRCDGCGEVRTQVLTGTWTLDQLRA